MNTAAGGSQRAFRQSENLQTNEPSMYRNKDYNATVTSNLGKNNAYLFYEGQKIRELDLTDRKQYQEVSSKLNMDGKIFYSK